jgi:4-hydroxy-3-methylbut-2-enyl diphosphate reductase
METSYFRKGFGLRSVITPQLTADYHSRIVELIRERDHRLVVGSLTFVLAREFGFCYGVDRAVEYAYETRKKFPDRQLYLVGEIIHNPHVNTKLEAMGIQFLRTGPEGRFDFSEITAEDVVVIPAFGVTMEDFTSLRAIGCALVDTTCGSVLNVWKRVERYARDGFTAIIHGKYWHEETKATASQVTKYEGGKYLIVLDMDEARRVMDFIEHGGDPHALGDQFRLAASPDFDFSSDLERVGLANQTTMLAGESLAIAEEFRQTMLRRFGKEAEAEHVRTFDTICSATQERQDALVQLLEDPPDLMIVIGGYNSSNTNHLAALARRRGVTTLHVEDAACIDPDAGSVRHRDPETGGEELVGAGWLTGVKLIGVTAGASTPNNKIGEAIERICATAGLTLGEDLL